MNQVLSLPQTTVLQETHSAGQTLLQVRLERGLSLEDVSKQTFIKLHYLQALEEDRFELLPAPVYTCGYIRQYARILNLDETDIVQRYQEARKLYAAAQQQEGAAPETAYFAPVLSHHKGQFQIETLQQPTRTGETHESMENSTLPANTAPAVVETVEGDRKDALAMRHQTEQFADQVLLHLEQEISKTLSVIQNGRTYLQQRLKTYSI